MAIMVAGGLTFAVPGMMPEVVAENENLFVSAYYPGNAYNDYYFGGAAIVEVVVRDPLISSTENSIPGAPRVEVNGDKLAMVQGADGSWYAYIADDTKATAADSESGMDFGTTCTPGSGGTAMTAVGLTDTSLFDDVLAVWVSKDDCASSSSTDIASTTHILKSAQGMSLSGTTNAGNVGIDGNTANGSAGGSTDLSWPFIQTYNFDDVSAEIVYHKSSGSETINVKYSSGKDSAHYATTDRTEYPPGAQVHIELMAPGLNIDPTSVENWTFDVGSETDASSDIATACYYNKFADADTNTSRTAINTGSSDLKLKDTCTLLITFDGGNVLDIQDNDDSVQIADHLTFLETGPSSGIFTNEDDDQDANLFVKTDAPRNTTAIINYDDSQQSIVIKNFTGSV
ncbi:hypothetical protein OAK01_06125, partial [Candidatus Nitrosopelagicus sp.]|nr:hypothetical protein [Candidatus Nitrosopelagicus sp.]